MEDWFVGGIARVCVLRCQPLGYLTQKMFQVDGLVPERVYTWRSDSWEGGGCMWVCMEVEVGWGGRGADRCVSEGCGGSGVEGASQA